MSYKTLTDPNKRKMYQKIMAEAREKTDFERDKENKKRKKLGNRSLMKASLLSQRILTSINSKRIAGSSSMRLKRRSSIMPSLSRELREEGKRKSNS